MKKSKEVHTDASNVMAMYLEVLRDAESDISAIEIAADEYKTVSELLSTYADMLRNLGA